MPEPHRRVAVLGGAGFIGHHFCRRLSDESALHSILDLRAPRTPISGVQPVIGDIRDRQALRMSLDGANAVLHLAAAHHDFGIETETYSSVNEGGAREICHVADEFGIRRICFFSTVAVYGSGVECPTEETVCRPESAYGQSKLAGEEVFRTWSSRGDGRSVLVIRPSVTFGSGHFANMYTLIRQISARMYATVGPGSNRKSLVYVDNLVEATMALWSRGDTTAFEVYNVVDKPDLSSREIATAVYRALGRRPPRFSVPLWLALVGVKPVDAFIALTGANLPVSSARVRKFAVSNTVFSAAKLAEAGYKPRVPLELGIQRMVEWYRDIGRFLPMDRSIPPREVAKPGPSAR